MDGTQNRRAVSKEDAQVHDVTVVTEVVREGGK